MSSDFLAYVNSLTYKLSNRQDARSLADLYLERISKEETSVTVGENQQSEESSTRPQSRAERLAALDSARSEQRIVKANDILDDVQKRKSIQRQTRNRRRLERFKKDNRIAEMEDNFIFNETIELSDSEKRAKINEIIASSIAVDPDVRPVVLGFFDLPDLIEGHSFRLLQTKNAVREAERSDIPLSLFNPDFNYTLEWLQSVIDFYNARKTFIENLDISNIVDITTLARRLNLTSGDMRNIPNTEALSYFNRELYASVFLGSPKFRYGRLTNQDVTFRSSQVSSPAEDRDLGINIPREIELPNIPFTPPWESIPERALSYRLWVDCFSKITGQSILTNYTSRTISSTVFRSTGVVSSGSPAMKRVILVQDLLSSNPETGVIGPYGLHNPIGLFLTMGRAIKLYSTQPVKNSNFYNVQLTEDGGENVFNDAPFSTAFNVPAIETGLGSLIYDTVPIVKSNMDRDSTALIESSLVYAGARGAYNSTSDVPERGIVFNTMLLSDGRVSSMPFEAKDFGSAPELPETAIDIISSITGGNKTSGFMNKLTTAGLLDEGELSEVVSTEEIKEKQNRIPPLTPYVYPYENARYFSKALDSVFTSGEPMAMYVNEGFGERNDEGVRRQDGVPASPGIVVMTACNKTFIKMMNGLADALAGDPVSSSAYGIQSMGDISEPENVPYDVLNKARSSAAIAILSLSDVMGPDRRGRRSKSDEKDLLGRKALLTSILGYAMNHPGISAYVESRRRLGNQLFEGLNNQPSFIERIKAQFPPSYDIENAFRDNANRMSGVMREDRDAGVEDLEYQTSFRASKLTNISDTPANKIRAKLYSEIFGVSVDSGFNDLAHVTFVEDDMSGVRGGGMLQMSMESVNSTADEPNAIGFKPLNCLSFNANPHWAAISFMPGPDGIVRTWGVYDRDFYDREQRMTNGRLVAVHNRADIMGRTAYSGIGIDELAALNLDAINHPVCHSLDFLDHAAIGIYDLFFEFASFLVQSTQVKNNINRLRGNRSGDVTLGELNSVVAPGGLELSDECTLANFTSVFPEYIKLMCPDPAKMFETMGLKFSQRIHPYRGGSTQNTNILERRRLDAREQLRSEFNELPENQQFGEVGFGGEELNRRDELSRKMYATELANTSIYEIGFDLSQNPANSVNDAIDKYLQPVINSLNYHYTLFTGLEELSLSRNLKKAYGTAKPLEDPAETVDVNQQTERLVMAGAQSVISEEGSKELQKVVSGFIDSYKVLYEQKAHYNGGPTGYNPLGKDFNNFSPTVFTLVTNMCMEILKEDSFVVNMAAALTLYYDNIRKSAIAAVEKGMSRVSYQGQDVSVYELMSSIKNLTPEHIQTIFSSIHALNNVGEEPGGRKTIDQLTDKARLDFCVSRARELSVDHSKIAVIGLPVGLNDKLERTPPETGAGERKSFSKNEIELDMEFHDITGRHLPTRLFSTRFMKGVRETGLFVPSQNNAGGFVPSFFMFDGDGVLDARKVSADSIAFSKFTPMAYNTTLNDIALKDFIDLYYDVDVRESAFPAHPDYATLISEQKYPIRKIAEVDQTKRLFLTASCLAFDPNSRALSDFEFYDTVDMGGEEVPAINPLMLDIKNGYDVGIFNSIAAFGNIQDNKLADLKFSKGLQFERVICIPILREYSPDSNPVFADNSIMNKPFTIYRSSVRVKLLQEGKERDSVEY